MSKYYGKKGKQVIFADDLQKAARTRKSVCFVNSDGKILQVTPASFIMNRNYGEVLRMLRNGNMFVYEKPEKPKLERKYPSRRPGKREGVKRCLERIAQCYAGNFGSKEKAGVAYYILQGLDPNIAKAIEDEHFKFSPDSKKANTELKKLCEGGK